MIKFYSIKCYLERAGVPVIKASKGLAPSSHFPVGFRLPVDSAVMALRAMTAHIW